MCIRDRCNPGSHRASYYRRARLKIFLPVAACSCMLPAIKKTGEPARLRCVSDCHVLAWNVRPGGMACPLQYLPRGESRMPRAAAASYVSGSAAAIECEGGLEMRITPLDVRKQEFRKGMRGLDPDEVYAFLATVADEYEAALNDNKALRERLLELDDKVQEYRTIERTLRDTLVTAERVTVESKDLSLIHISEPTRLLSISYA